MFWSEFVYLVEDYNRSLKFIAIWPLRTIFQHRPRKRKFSSKLSPVQALLLIHLAVHFSFFRITFFGSMLDPFANIFAHFSLAPASHSLAESSASAPHCIVNLPFWNQYTHTYTQPVECRHNLESTTTMSKFSTYSISVKNRTNLWKRDLSRVMSFFFSLSLFCQYMNYLQQYLCESGVLYPFSWASAYLKRVYSFRSYHVHIIIVRMMKPFWGKHRPKKKRNAQKYNNLWGKRIFHDYYMRWHTTHDAPAQTLNKILIVPMCDCELIIRTNIDSPSQVNWQSIHSISPLS